ncbi:MAG: FAD-dependent oxidoreductase [Clostridia bacterium]|nr:FAD-dependent oxidoreductase [Clostridia bacterium]
MKEYIKLTIDGVEVTAEKGQTVLEAARQNSIDIPTLCHDERVAPYGACGLCVVEAEGNPKLLRSCATKAADGMKITTNSERIHRARKFALQMLLSDHTGDCKAPCSLACPAGTDCQGYVGLIANGENAEATRVIKSKIPMPASIGRVCPHPCETACRRQMVEEPIAIAALKAYAADKDLAADEQYTPEVLAPTGKSVAVIGGGPGGLSAAYYLALKGHSVTVYDMMPKMGGMLRYGIPQYRLPKEVLDKEIALIERTGVKLQNNIKIGTDITLDELRASNDAVVVAVGAWVSSKMRVKGEDLDGVYGGIDFLRSVILGKAPKIGEKVAVCGGGNTAMDACRTAVRLGAKEVYIIYRRTRDEMPADELEIDEAEEEGVIFKFLTNPDEILSKDGKVCGIRLQVMELGEPDASGRRKPVPVDGKFENIELDSVIMAIGQKSNLEGLEALELTSWGTISADEATFRTNLDGVFAVGDATNKGADIAISAIGEAQKSANVIDSYLNGCTVGYKKPILVERKITAEDLKDKKRIPREKVRVLSPEDRKHNFSEVAFRLTDEQAKAEASRCLECGCLDYYRCKLIKYSNEYDADFSKFIGEKSVANKDTEHPYIMRDSGKCILCGLCVRVCSEVMNVTAIGLAGRGFTTVVSPEFYQTLNDSKCISCGQCVTLCPTGALIEKVPFKKDVPLEEKSVKTHCTGCANACKLTAFSVGSTLTRTEPVAGGILCTEGRLGFAVINNPEKISNAVINGELVSVDDAANKTAQTIKSYTSDEVAVTVCDNLTDEALAAAKKLADTIGTSTFITLGNPKKCIADKDVAEFERVFGDKFNIGINSQKSKDLGAIPAESTDLSKIKAVISFGSVKPEFEDIEFIAVQGLTADIKADIIFPLVSSFETDGTFGGEIKISKAVKSSSLSNEDIIDRIINYLK